MKIFRSNLHHHHHHHYDSMSPFLSMIAVVVFASCLTRRISAEPLWSDVCTQVETSKLPFCDTTKNLDERIHDYVKRIPIENQITMMGNNASGYVDLMIPPYQWWSEGLHGPLEPCVQYEHVCACPTSFPSPSAMGNAFNRTLYRLVGGAIGTEGRSISNLRKHNMAIGDGLTYWSPTINMQRDPRWGRNQEVPGEDPYLTSQYSKAFVEALQGTDADADSSSSSSSSSRLRLGACCKHFLANSLEHWGNYSRHNFDAQIDQEDLHNYYLPPFEECVKSKAAGVMCSYNSVNGAPACANPWLLQQVLREKWNFTGYLVTDCGALSDVVRGHNFATDDTQTSAMAKNASVDVNCGNTFGVGLLKAHNEGQVTGATINESFGRMARIQFRLGLFDSPKKDNPQEDIASIGSPQHRQLALEAALQSIVLLQNKNNLLPLDVNEKKSLAVIGPHFNATKGLFGNYHGSPCKCRSDGSMDDDFSCIETPLQAIKRMKSPDQVKSLMGCDIAGKDDSSTDIERAKKLAQESDIVILLLGLDQSQEKEELDRYETTLPGLQPKLMESVLDVAGEKTIVVLIHGGSVSLGDIRSKAGAILSAGYGGEVASDAIASVLFGYYNPTGKLAATMYPSSFVHELPLTEMGLRVGVGRTHMYYQGTPEFAFGHGLSYSKWKIDWVDDCGGYVEDGSQNTPPTLKLHESTSTRLQLSVQNVGPHTPGSSQTILLFWRPFNGINKDASSDFFPVDRSEKRKIRQKLIDFQQTSFLDMRQSETIEFELNWKDFALWNSTNNASLVSPGSYELVVQVADTHMIRRLEVVSSLNIQEDDAFSQQLRHSTTLS